MRPLNGSGSRSGNSLVGVGRGSGSDFKWGFNPLSSTAVETVAWFDTLNVGLSPTLRYLYGRRSRRLQAVAWLASPEVCTNDQYAFRLLL